MSGWTIVWIVLLSLLGLLVLLLAVPIYLRVTFHGELTVLVRVWGSRSGCIRARRSRKRRSPKAEKPKKSRKQKPGKLRKESMSVSQMLKEDGVGAVVSYYTSWPGCCRPRRDGSCGPSRWTIWISAWSWRRGRGRDRAKLWPRLRADFPGRGAGGKRDPGPAAQGPGDAGFPGVERGGGSRYPAPCRARADYLELFPAALFVYFSSNTPAGSNVKEAGSHG